MLNGTYFEPQRASVRAGSQVITCKSGPHASAWRLNIYKVSAIGLHARSADHPFLDKELLRHFH